MKLPFRIPHFSLIVLLATAPSVLSQEAAPAPVIDIAARKQSVVNLEAHIADREARLAEMKKSIVDLDARVEKGIDKIVTRLEETSDSKDSQVRVVEIKKSAIVGLRKTIEYYVRKRDEIKEQILKGFDVPREDLIKDVKVFDQRIEKRIGQVIALTKSFPEYKEIDKYDERVSSSWGWNWTEVEINPEWRLNNKQVRHTESEIKEIVAGLKASIERLKGEHARLAERLKAEGLSEKGRAYFEQELASNESVISMREKQMETLFSSADDGYKVEETKVNRSEAHSMQLAIEDMSKDLRKDFFSIFEQYADLNRQRGQLAKLKKNLQARKDWLVEYEAKE